MAACAALALPLVLAVSASASVVTPLAGLYEGTDSAGERVAFTVSPAGEGRQAVFFRAAGSYAAICSPFGLVLGPLMSGRCQGGPFPDPEHPPSVIGKVGLNAVYADATADRFNDAVFNGTLTASAQAWEEAGAPIAYPALTWRAVLTEPAAVATVVGGQGVVEDGVARLEIGCDAKGLSSCTGVVKLRSGAAGAVAEQRFRVRDESSRLVSIQLPGALARALAGAGRGQVSAKVVSDHPRARSVERKSAVTLLSATRRAR